MNKILKKKVGIAAFSLIGGVALTCGAVAVNPASAEGNAYQTAQIAMMEGASVRYYANSATTDESGIVTLHIKTTGVFNRMAQKFLKKPKVSFVHLDEMGSFVWPLLCEEKNILALGEEVKVQFGDKAEPLYERLAKYFQILDSYHFIVWKEK